MVKIISERVLNRSPEHWMLVHSTFPKTYNFSEICPRLGFWFYNEFECENLLLK